MADELLVAALDRNGIDLSHLRQRRWHMMLDVAHERLDGGEPQVAGSGAIPALGAAWSKRSNEGRDYLSVKLDDPSFIAPIYANLFDDEDGEGFTLIWSRGRKPNGD